MARFRLPPVGLARSVIEADAQKLQRLAHLGHIVPPGGRQPQALAFAQQQWHADLPFQAPAAAG